MANRPRCEVGPRFLDSGPVPFGLPVRLAVRVENVGPVEAVFYFVAPPRPRGVGAAGGGGGGGRVVAWDDDTPLAPEWLELAPEEGTVEAGGAREVALTACVTGGAASAALAAAPPPPPPRGGRGGGGGPAAAAAAAAAEVPLDAILILRIEDGSDAFISVSGSYVGSCFGRDLSDLASLGPAPAAPRAALSAAALALREAAGAAGAAAAAAEAAARGGGEGDSGSGGGGGGGGARPLIDMGEEEGGGDAAAAGGGGSGGAEREEPPGPAVDLPAPPALPKEIARLTAFLARRLDCPGLFVHSCELACGLPPRGRRPRGRAQVQKLLAATADVRWALDIGEELPPHATPHQVRPLLTVGRGGGRATRTPTVAAAPLRPPLNRPRPLPPLARHRLLPIKVAATLLALFHQLPAPLMPPAVSSVLSRAVPSAAASAQLLAGALAPAEWAAARHVVGLLRAALAPGAVQRNGLTVLVRARGAAGRGLPAAARRGIGTQQAWDAVWETPCR
jgi:hypothetical protein